MQVDILTPDKSLFSGEATIVTIPGISGSFQIKNNHAPIISALGKGNIVIEGGADGKMEFEVKGGIVEVLKNKIIILA